MKTATVVLAAGMGTRMRSSLPKVMHPVLGKPILWHVLRSAADAGSGQPVVVIGHGAELVRDTFSASGVSFVYQHERLGTGHAVLQARDALAGKSDQVLVIYGDMPLWRTETLREIIAVQAENAGPITMAVLEGDDPRGFGRVVRDPSGNVSAIVEEAQSTPAQLAIKELNVGLYCFDAAWLWDAVARIPLSPKGEYYLTDLVGMAVMEGKAVHSIPVRDAAEAVGINTRVHLAEAEALLRERLNRSLMESGITMIDPQRTYIEIGIEIGQDTILYPDTYLRGETRIGNGCCIGPNTIITDSQIGNGCTILASVLEKAVLENEVEMGPFARLRPGAHLADHVHMGNFGEVKNSYLAPGVKMGHFSYIGDAQVGENVNIGCGTVTCNYDGRSKNKTVIGDNTFIGSGTMLVAPLEIGESAYTGAGSVVTHDVPAGTTVVGVPAREHKRKEQGS
ncbi:MAG: bifunctional UDP-N-acetylglucosamine diphosphorylase/glucosamine-1-phosphate N-acetyltransferase GlmU [Anaerolineae bacterium]|nr:bifunctional UDP-N-acetylglucosamine diphosphorylase/glucosamine-1-phosphate N-acetyltransferase GlmU [Anaerolineae bacterium]